MPAPERLEKLNCILNTGLLRSSVAPDAILSAAPLPNEFASLPRNVPPLTLMVPVKPDDEVFILPKLVGG